MSPSVTVSVERAEGTEISEKQYQRGVKHLCDNGAAKVPKKYILPISDRPRLCESERDMKKQNLKLPVIDFAELMSPNRAKALKTLANACEAYGFFQLVNHEISEEVIRGMREVSRRFFELPYEERSKYMSSELGSPVRYGTSFNQNKDNVFYWRDFLKLMSHPLPDLLPHWPSSPSNFRNSAAAYAKETKLLFQMIVEAITESLGLCNHMRNQNSNIESKEKEENHQSEYDDDEILKQLEDGSQMIMINCYPPCPEPELTLGMPPHSDYGFLTLLLQDDVEGLQIQFRDQWLTVHPVPGSFVVNVGDHLEIFSNGRYKSVLHRVLVNSSKPRISVASLHSFPLTWKVSPSPELVNDSNPKRYMDTDFATFLDYLKSCEPKKKNFLESRKIDQGKI